MLCQLDVNNDDDIEEVYMQTPSAMENKSNKSLCRSRRPLYRLKKSPRGSVDKFSIAMVKSGYY